MGLARAASGSVLEPLAWIFQCPARLRGASQAWGWQEGIGKYPLSISRGLTTGAATVCAGHPFSDVPGTLSLWGRYMRCRGDVTQLQGFLLSLGPSMEVPRQDPQFCFGMKARERCGRNGLCCPGWVCHCHFLSPVSGSCPCSTVVTPLVSSVTQVPFCPHPRIPCPILEGPQVPWHGPQRRVL